MLKDFYIYNSRTRKKEIIRTLTPGVLKFYGCGPTVYSYAHIGNFRTFLTADLIVRTAKAAGYTVKFVSNITDVGHLVEDDRADAGGEDKMSKALRTANQQFANIWDLARHFTDALLSDWQKLNLLSPDVRPRATEHVTEQLELIQRLIEKGHAYETALGVYFDVSSFENYGALSGNTLEELKEGVRNTVSDPHKKNPQDFALWKKDKQHLMRWFSPYGWGYPGWHIECSAMAIKYLGQTFDLHAGGEDNKFPHHECEIAQSEASTGKPFVHYWAHTAHLLVDGARMSKSAGNFFTVSELLDEKNIDASALRYALTCAIYRETLNFTKESLVAGERIAERIQNTYDLLIKSGGTIETVEEKKIDLPQELSENYSLILDAMLDDLNTPVAYANFVAGLKWINKNFSKFNKENLSGCLHWFKQCDDLLGLINIQQKNTANIASSGNRAESDIQLLLTSREEARKNKDFALADKIREELLSKGIEIKDTSTGTEWSYIK